jgi:hypothetical protein
MKNKGENKNGQITNIAQTLPMGQIWMLPNIL